MMFGADHFVPVLKVKQNEKKALESIMGPIRAHITPLLEIVERKDKDIDSHLKTAFKDLAKSVSPYQRCFLDTRELESDGPVAAAKVFEMAKNEGIVFTPVTGISRSADVGTAISHREHGLALRLTRAEFETGNLANRIHDFMSYYQLAPEDVDLIMDLGPVDDMIPYGIAALAIAFLNEVPDHAKWRSFTISACAFPWSMSVVNARSHRLVERAEWVAWRDELFAKRSDLTRLPTFSDCAIQHPAGVEGFDPRFMSSSAAIRYTTQDKWLLIKGESTRITPQRKRNSSSPLQPNLSTVICISFSTIRTIVLVVRTPKKPQMALRGSVH